MSETMPKDATLEKRNPYLRRLSHTTRSATGRQQHGGATNHCDDTLLPAAGEENFHRLVERSKSCEIEGSGGELVTLE